MNIAITNRSTVLTDTQLQAALPAYRHFASLVASGWGLKTPTITFTGSASPASTSWQIVVLDTSDQAGALGYHDFTLNGRPIAKVFAKDDISYGYDPNITLTHELGEMQVDPWINAAVQTSDSRFYALEVGDPVEDDAYGFSYTSVAGLTTRLSNFVLPPWFQPGAHGPYDHQGACTAPLQVKRGGYAQYHDGAGWHQVGPNGQRMVMDADDQRLRTRF